MENMIIPKYILKECFSTLLMSMYDSFGNEMKPDGMNDNPFRYCGEGGRGSYVEMAENEIYEMFYMNFDGKHEKKIAEI